MKRIHIFISFLLVALCFSSATFAFDDACFTADGLQKFYVQSTDVKVANNGIFVLFEGDMLNVSAIHFDSYGAYIAGMGVCRYCDKPNDNTGKCQNARCRNYGRG